MKEKYYFISGKQNKFLIDKYFPTDDYLNRLRRINKFICRRQGAMIINIYIN